MDYSHLYFAPLRNFSEGLRYNPFEKSTAQNPQTRKVYKLRATRLYKKSFVYNRTTGFLSKSKIVQLYYSALTV